MLRFVLNISMVIMLKQFKILAKLDLTGYCCQILPAFWVKWAVPDKWLNKRHAMLYSVRCKRLRVCSSVHQQEICTVFRWCKMAPWCVQNLNKNVKSTYFDWHYISPPRIWGHTLTLKLWPNGGRYSKNHVQTLKWCKHLALYVEVHLYVSRILAIINSAPFSLLSTMRFCSVPQFVGIHVVSWYIWHVTHQEKSQSDGKVAEMCDQLVPAIMCRSKRN